MKAFLLLLLGLIVTCPSLAHKGFIKGVLYNKSDHQPLVGASVELVNTGRITYTDKLGTYTFSNLNEGTYELKFSYLGFETTTATVELKENNEVSKSIVTSLVESNISLNEVSVSSHRLEPMQAISLLDITLHPIQNSQDVLQLIPGLFIAQHAGGGKAEQIFLRGFDIDHGTDIHLSVDGMPVNMVSHAHGQGYADLHYIIPETIERVNFGKGPYRADKGNFATAGYAEFQTKRTVSSNLAVEAGSYNTYRTVGMFNLLSDNARVQGHNAYIATEYLYSNGYFESPQHLNRLNILGKYQGTFGKNKQLSASVSAFRSTWDASGQIPERAVKAGTINRFGAIDDTEGGVTSRYAVNTNLLHLLPNQAVLENQVYFINYIFELYSNFTFFLNDPVNGDQIRQRENRNLLGYKGSYTWEKGLGNKLLKNEIGVGVRQDLVDDSELSRTKDRTITLGPVRYGDISETNFSAYLSETLEISPVLSINSALRFDQFFFNYTDHLPQENRAKQTAAKFRVSPKVTITYTSSPNLQFYLNAGKGFHSNDTRVSVAANGRNELPAATGGDLGLLYKPTSKIILNSALWLLDLEQELVYVGDEGIVEPSGKTRRYGLDITMRYQLSKSLFLDTDLNLVKPRAREYEAGNKYIPLAPILTSTGGITYHGMGKRLYSSIKYRYLHHRPANEDYSLIAEGYSLVDVVARYTFKQLTFNLSMENLLNQDWKEAQFETESRLQDEESSVTEIHFTPGTPFFLKAGITYQFR